MIHVEEVTGLMIIGGPEFNKLGDPYAFSVLAKIQGESVYFTRMAGSFTKKDFNDIQQYFNSLGIYDAHWIRIKGNKTKKVRMGDIVKYLIIFGMLFIGGCAVKGVYQDCKPVNDSPDWVCNKSIWSR